MWCLKSQRDNSLFYMLAGRTYTINRQKDSIDRKKGDLVLDNDQSISRQHGAILISQGGEVFLSDEGSKYGTFIFEGEVEHKLEPHQKVKIKIGDKLRFGLQWNVFILCKMDFVVCTSSITAADKRLLKSILLKIGGKFSNDWNDSCTHLAMNQVVLTHKVVFALAAGKPITTVQFWQEMEEAISKQLTLPKIENYICPVGEEELQRQTKPDILLPNKSRKTLFQGKIFVFSSEDTKNKTRHLVECAGGVCTSVEASKLQPKAYCEPKYIVVRESEACKQLMQDILVTLKRKGLRPILVSEIGLAIYNNSLTRYCNPSWRKPALIGDSPSQSQGICLVENTEDINTQITEIKPRDDIVIPPSLESVVSNTSMNSSTRSVKRPLSTTSADNPPPKRQVRKQDTAKASGSLRQWAQRSGLLLAKDSEASCSKDTSGGDLFNTSSQNTQNNVSSKEDTDRDEEPSPKKTGRKRGRVEDDGFLEPSLKKNPNAGNVKKTSKLPSTIKAIRNDADKLDDDDSDDEFKVPSRVSRKKTVPRIEHDDFDLEPSCSKSLSVIDSSNRNVAKKTTIREDRPSIRSSEEMRELGSTGQTKETAEVSRVNNEIAVPRPESRIETSSTSATSSSRGNDSKAPSLSEFLDKSVGVLIKKEEPEDDEIDKDLTNMVVYIKEISLYRKPPPLREISSNSTNDGRPNFKKFKKSMLRIKRTRINLIVDHDASTYDGVLDPDAPTADTTNGSSNYAPESQNAEDLFPSTNERSQASRGKAPRRVESQIVDEWTVP